MKRHGMWLVAMWFVGLTLLPAGRVAAAFAPDDIADLQLWLKADAGVYEDAGTNTTGVLQADASVSSGVLTLDGTGDYLCAVFEQAGTTRIHVNGALEHTVTSGTMQNNAQTFQVGARRSASGGPANFFSLDADGSGVATTPVGRV